MLNTGSQADRESVMSLLPEHWKQLMNEAATKDKLNAAVTPRSFLHVQKKTWGCETEDRGHALHCSVWRQAVEAELARAE